MAIILQVKESTREVFVNRLTGVLRDTWSVDREGDFTHTPQQWVGKAWFRIRPAEDSCLDSIKIGIIQSRQHKLTPAIYAVYHGRFVEMLLAHFDKYITDIRITPLLDYSIDYRPEPSVRQIINNFPN